MDYDYINYESVGLLTYNEIIEYSNRNMECYPKKYIDFLNRVATNIIEIKSKKLFTQRVIEIKFHGNEILLPFLPITKLHILTINNINHHTIPKDIYDNSEIYIKYSSISPHNDVIKMAIMEQIYLILDNKYTISQYII